MIEMFKRFLTEKDGVTAIEYGLIAGLVAVVIIGAVSVVGKNVSLHYSDIANKLSVLTAEVKAAEKGKGNNKGKKKNKGKERERNKT